MRNEICGELHIYLHHLGNEDQPWVKEVMRKLDLLLRTEQRSEKYEMATKETLDRLTAQVTANTDAVQSAKIALEGYVTTNEELTRKLTEALAGDDEAAVSAAAEALTANNVTLRAAIPAVSTAVGANTR